MNETYFSAITALGEVDYVNLEKTFFKINGRDMQKEINTSIHTLAVGSSAVLVVTDDPDLHNKSVSDSYRPNRIGNLMAFDANGDLLWRINDLYNDVHFPFCGGHFASKEEREHFSKWHQIDFDPNHEYFIGLTYADEHYIIDLTSQKLVARKVLRT